MMNTKKLVAAIMALAMTASMTAFSANAEESTDDVAVQQTETQQQTEAPQTEAQETEEAPTTKPTETEAQKNTETTITTMAIIDTFYTTTTKSAVSSEESSTEKQTTAATATTAKETISKDLAAPKMGDFKVSAPVEGADGTDATISWGAVTGADGYQIYRTLVYASEADTPTSYAFDVKGTSYKTSTGSEAWKETIKVRAFKLVDGKRVYGAWSESRTVYMNGMKEDATTTAKKSTTKATSTTAKTTTTTGSKTESPKTSDSANIPAVAATAVLAMLAGTAVLKKRK